MGIQINGQNDTVSASDGSINISGEISATVLNQTVTGVTTFSDATFTNGFNVTGVVTATQVNVGTAITISAGVITATSFSGDGSGLSGIDASSLKSGGVVKVQANSSGSVTTGVATATDKISVGDSFIQNGAVGLGTTTQSDVLSGVGTAVGLIHFIPAVGLQIYTGSQFGWRTIANTVGQEGVASGGFIDGAPGGDGKLYHVFTSTSTLNVVGGVLPGANIFVVAGGGSGGVSINGNGGGGGGAGGIAYYPNVDIPSGSHTVTVGGGGAGKNSPFPSQGNRGNDSSFSSSPNPFYVLSKGGGGGTSSPSNPDAPGGSGGGGGITWPNGTGTQPAQNAHNPSILNYGNDGGQGNAGPGSIGGGGGAGAAGGGGTGSGSGYGGGVGQGFAFLPGTLPALAPMPSAYRTATGPTGLHGGGGGAGAYSGSPGPGGPGGGGAGGGGSSQGGAAGIQYTGGGAGGGQGALSGNGGDGLVVIYYPE